MILALLSILLIVYLVSSIVKTLLPKVDTRCVLYSKRILKKAKCTMNDRWAGVWCSEKYTILVLDNGTIGVCKKDILIFRIEICNLNKDVKVFKNQLLTRLDNNVYVDNKIIKISNATKYGVKIGIKNMMFETNISRGKIQIADFVMVVKSGSIADIILDNGNMFIVFGSDNVEVEFCEEMKAVDRKCAMQIAREYFGIFDKANEIWNIPDYNANTRKRIEYIQTKLDKRNWEFANIALFSEYDNQLIEKDFLLNSTKIRFNLTKLGIANIYAIKKLHKNELCIKDLVTNYTFFLHFGADILNFQKYTFWGECYVLIELAEVCSCKFCPFNKSMDISFLDLPKINVLEKLLVNKQLDGESYSLNMLIRNMNMAILLGKNVDVNMVLKNLVLDKLSEKVKFELANMILSYIQVMQNKDILKRDDVLLLLMEQNKALYKRTKGEAKCYLMKLINIIEDFGLQSCVMNLLDDMQDICDMTNWESVFSNVLGIMLVGQKLYFLPTKFEYDTELCIRGKVIKLVRRKDTNFIKCNGRVLVGIDYVNLDIEEEKLNVEL